MDILLSRYEQNDRRCIFRWIAAEVLLSYMLPNSFEFLQIATQYFDFYPLEMSLEQALIVP